MGPTLTIQSSPEVISHPHPFQANEESDRYGHDDESEVCDARCYIPGRILIVENSDSILIEKPVLGELPIPVQEH